MLDQAAHCERHTIRGVDFHYVGALGPQDIGNEHGHLLPFRALPRNLSGRPLLARKGQAFSVYGKPNRISQGMPWSFSPPSARPESFPLQFKLLDPDVIEPSRRAPWRVVR